MTNQISALVKTSWKLVTWNYEILNPFVIRSITDVWDLKKIRRDWTVKHQSKTGRLKLAYFWQVGLPDEWIFKIIQGSKLRMVVISFIYFTRMPWIFDHEDKAILRWKLRTKRTGKEKSTFCKKPFKERRSLELSMVDWAPKVLNHFEGSATRAPSTVNNDWAPERWFWITLKYQ